MVRLRQGSISMAFIKGQARRQANKEWSSLVAQLSRERGYVTFRRTKGDIPRIPKALQRTPKRLASRFFQLASGHAMIAPFLKEKFGWVNSDTCWWCSRGMQTREHLFKECSAWKQEIRKLWKDVEEATGDREARLRGGIYKGKKGFRLGSQGQDGRRVRSPENTSIR